MRKRKTTNGVPKTPKETGTWYKSLIEGKNKAEYYRHFIKKINDISAKYFGVDETNRVMKALESQKIQVMGIESFLFDFNDISDPTMQLYGTCKSAEELLAKSIIYFKGRAEKGETNIPVQNFFLILSDLLANDVLYTKARIRELIKNLVTSLITVRDKTPYNFIILEPKWASAIGEKLGLNETKYCTVFYMLLSVIQELMDYVKSIRAYLPTLKILYPVYYSVRDNQLTYLTAHFRLIDRPNIVKSTLKEIEDLSIDTPYLRSCLEYLRTYANLPFLEIDPIILKLQEIGESSSLKRYPDKNSLSKVFNLKIAPKNYYNNFNITPSFVNKETFEKGLVPYFCDVHINCSKIKNENVESFIDAAKTICLTKGYYAQSKRNIDELTFKITLTNVKNVTEDFMKFIREKEKSIKSLTNKNFIIDVYYDGDTVNQKIPEELITHIRIISDIHTDYNREHGYVFSFGNDFIVNCGDTSGNALTTGHWISNYMKRGVVVIGNHFGYSSSHPERDGVQNLERYSNLKHPSNTKRDQLMELYNLTSKNDVILLSNTCTEYKGIIIIGTCLYTDFDLYGKEHREECMSYAKKSMNDFRLPVVLDNQYYTQTEKGYWLPWTRKKSESKIRPFDTSDHAFYFQYSFGFIRKKVEENKHKPIIIVTHHAPSPHSIDKKYEGDLLNAAFASNLNQYIIQNPQIRVWAHGHVHNPCDYILGETRVVCCPFGYNNENNFNLPYEYGLRIPIEEIKSKKSWRKILKKDIKSGLVQVYDE